jgi:hypothetical protein
MDDWIGLLFILALIAGAVIGIRILANPRPRTVGEFEQNAAENPTMVGALMNALHDVTDPGAARAKEVRMQMKEGRFQKRKREGKAGGEADDESTEEKTDD